jgi:hypothetical protein
MASRVHHSSNNTRHESRRGSLDRRPPVLAALYTGLTTTVVATIAPYLDQATSHSLAHHIRAGYPSFTQARVDAAVTIYEVLLTVIGVLGAAGWGAVIHGVTTGRRWTTPLATALFLVGLGIALTGLLIKDTSGEAGLSSLLGWVGLLPCLPGLLAVTMLWRRPRPCRRERDARHHAHGQQQTAHANRHSAEEGER